MFLYLDCDFSKNLCQISLKLGVCLSYAKIAPDPDRFVLTNSEFQELCGFVYSGIVKFPEQARSRTQHETLTCHSFTNFCRILALVSGSELA